MKLTKWVLIVLIFVVALLAGTPGWSEDESPQSKAQSFKKALALMDESLRLNKQGKYADAIPYAEKGLEIFEKLLGPEHPNKASFVNYLGFLYNQAGAYDKSESLIKLSLAIREKALGPDHPDTAASLNSLGTLYQDMGAYDKAEPLIKRALVIREKVLGPEHPNTAASLNSLGILYEEMGVYNKAVPLYRRSLAIYEKALGPEHFDTATSLNNLALLYKKMGSYDKAEPLLKRALVIREKVLGPEHPNTAVSLNSLGLLYKDMGVYDKAEPLYRRSLAIYEKALGPEHPDTALGLNNLAALYNAMGFYDKAEPLYKRSLAIREKVLGQEHSDTANSLNSLAEFYRTMGSYDKAEPIYKRALAIREKVLGQEHPDTANSLNNLGFLYEELGAYDKAEPLIKRALAIREKALGPDHPNTANSLNDLGLLYNAMGFYDKAEPLYKRSLAINEKVPGPEHPDTAIFLNNLAARYDDIGAYDKAEPLYKRSLAIREKALGPDHPDTALGLNNLAALYDKIGAYDKAEPLIKRSLAIREKVLGPEHPDTAVSLNNLAALYNAMGFYDKAEPLYKKSLAIREKALGLDHPDTAIVLNNLGLLYYAQRRSGDALALMERAQQIDRKHVDQILGFASEKQQTQYLATLENNFFGYLNLIYQLFPNNTTAVRNSLDVWLARKGILLETQKRIQDVLAGDDNTKAREIFTDLTHCRQELARLVLGGPGKEGQAYQKRIAELTNQKEMLEGQLSRLSQVFAQQKKTKIATTATVAAALSKGTVLIEMARIQDIDFNALKKGAFRYIAFVLSAGKGTEVSLVDLGNADNIDKKVAAFKKSLGNSETSPDVLAKQSNDLYKLIFAPLTSVIGESKQIFLSPDGSLNLIPFEVLQDNHGRYLIETHTFHYVSAGRDIAGYGMIKEKGQKAILMGDPDFDLAAGMAPLDKEKKVALSRSMKGINFSRLPGTKKEVEAISAILGSTASNSYTGKAATESVLTQSKSPRIVHLATHGFFLSDQDWSLMVDEKSRGIKIIGKDKDIPKKQVHIENPFLRAGLALAGANNSLAQEGASEGILTAEKILGLNLRGTDMVVLSACETGMGDVKNGEGVYGLRRAFTQAGAKSLVMSMWEVPDVETKELMVNFYKNLQSGKMNRAEALRQAALKQRQTVKARYGKDNPYYWAAFVFLGEAE